MGLDGRKACVLLSLLFLAPALHAGAGQALPDVVGEEIRTFCELMASPVAEYRLEGIQGAAHLRLHVFEPDLIRLLRNDDPLVRQEAAAAVGRCGTWRTVPHLIRLLDDPQWAVRQHAHMALRRMTRQALPPSPRQAWDDWWGATTLEQKQARLLAELARGGPGRRHAAARALRGLATPALETKLLTILRKGAGIGPEERAFLTEALDRIGTARSRPYFVQRVRIGDVAAAWALGRRGGQGAEEALIAGYRRTRRLDFLLNLDRLKSTKCGPLVPMMCLSLPSLIDSSYRSQDLRHGPSPLHRVVGNLIRRSGRGPELVETVLAQLESKADAPVPEDLMPLVRSLRSILQPGFIREGYSSCACLLVAFSHVADGKALVPRLIPLLRHSSTTARIYVAITLGRLGGAEAVGPILAVVREGYPFSDAAAPASGKHTGVFRVVDGKRQRQSQTVRWRGYLCMALGRIGAPAARRALDTLAVDPGAPRDVRYGSVVGLGFIGSPESLPALRKVADSDIIWMIRWTAKQTLADMELAQRIAGGRARDRSAP